MKYSHSRGRLSAIKKRKKRKKRRKRRKMKRSQKKRKNDQKKDICISFRHTNNGRKRCMRKVIMNNDDNFCLLLRITCDVNTSA